MWSGAPKPSFLSSNHRKLPARIVVIYVPMIYVVLGMHKSGTTMISEILHHSGINMVDNADPSLTYDKGNKWERESTKQINHTLLGSEGAFSLVNGKPAKLSMTPEIKDSMRGLISDYNRQYPEWGFKDPRTCYVYGLWASTLPEHKIVVVYRSPQETWEHYRRISGRQMLSAIRQFLPRWTEYNGTILEHLRETKMKFLVIRYERFMNDPEEFKRLERFVGRPLNDRRDPKLHRSRPKKFGWYPVLRAFHALSGRRAPEGIVRRLEEYAKAAVPE